MNLCAPFRIDSFFLLAGLSASAALHASLLLFPQHLTVPEEFAVQPSDFSLEMSLVETSAGQPVSANEKVMTSTEPSPETTSPSQDSYVPAPLTPEISPRLTPTPAPTHTSTTPASSTVLARPDASHNSPPLYPEHARKKGWDGTVLLRANISIQGAVESITLVQGSGHTILDQAATAAVRQWRFFPKRVDGQPSPSVVEIPVKFSLKH